MIGGATPISLLGQDDPDKEVLISGNVTEKELKDAVSTHDSSLPVHFWRAGISRSGLKYLSTLSRLKSLSVSDSMITDEDLAYIGKLQGLTDLTLAFNEKVTDAGLKHLDGLKNLRRLDIAFTGVKGSGLSALSRLPLTKLHLSGSQVDDDGMQSVAGIASLETLDIGDTRISDKGVEKVRGLKNLKKLDLQLNRITDKSIPALESLIQLEELNIEFTDLSAAGYEKLRLKLNKTKILR
jgi:Leucine-rich repeat (LRR) protein